MQVFRVIFLPGSALRDSSKDRIVNGSRTMPREIVVRSPHTLKVSGITSAFRSYTALVMVAPCPTLELRRYHYVLRVPLPGVLRHTLKVHLKDETLVVSGRWEGGDVSGAEFYG